MFIIPANSINKNKLLKIYLVLLNILILIYIFTYYHFIFFIYLKLNQIFLIYYITDKFNNLDIMILIKLLIDFSISLKTVFQIKK